MNTETEAGWIKQGNGLGEGEEPWYDSLFKVAVPAVASAFQQSQLTKLNIARTSVGQAPISAAEFTRTLQPPAASVQVGLNQDTQKLLLYAAAGVGLLVALKVAKVL